MKHISIIPLIGGMTLASEKVFGKRPEVLLSYDAFKGNDSHLVNYYENEIPYYLLDGEHSFKASTKYDVVSTTCPCAGLSTLSHHSGADNPKNEWMAITAEYVLGTLQPQVFWGENAPTFAGNTGAKIRNAMFDIARKHGYTMSIYKTKSLLHGIPQYRARSFYFFWKEKNRVPVLEFYNKPMQTIEDLLENVTGNTQRELTNNKVPTDNQYYKFILDVMHPGLSHPEFIAQLDKSYELTGYIRSRGVTFPELADYFRKQGNDKEADKCERRQRKLDSGGGIMTRALYVPHERIGAFVGHLPTNMTHHRENRFLSFRECMSIMGLPENFELLNPKKNLNHVCQNVPVSTATDMAVEIKAYLEGKRPMEYATQLFQSNDKHTTTVWEKQEKTLETFMG